MLILRPLGPEDIEDVLMIYANAYPANVEGDVGLHRRREKILRDFSEDREVTMIGAFDEKERLLGTMKLVPFTMNLFGKASPALGLMALGVHPLAKRRGIARKMVAYFEEMAKTRGDLITLLLPFDIGFYKRLGYAISYRLDTYRIETRGLPHYWSSTHRLVGLSEEDLGEFLACQWRMMEKTHGMLSIMGEEIRGAKDGLSFYVGVRDRHDILRGGMKYHFAPYNDTNYMVNRLVVDHLIYEDTPSLRLLLSFLRRQEDQAPETILSTGDPYLCDVMENPADVRRGYVDYGYLESHLRSLGTMVKLPNPRAFVEGTGHREFLPLSLTLRIEDIHGEFSPFTLAFYEEEGVGRWRAVDEEADLRLTTDAGTLGSLFLGSLSFEALMHLELGHLSDPSKTRLLDSLFHVPTRPWTNTDY